ncbi:hypothetical protein JT31_18360 [Cedecea neteri]|uniref:DUF3800 domain-containing protein n=1 Tax=Cedecea neteri TaxID=158822 RepID=A0A089Q2J2_9ENTR|nr:DUF3800 domain-containing protein [Cedecea neteri]AIR06503.1 hypothetical protein JT31_18360 [Cedecea neteri]
MEIPFFDSPDNRYTFYYDESGNDRKFYIREDFSGYNVQRKGLHFFLAGVAHRGNSTTADANALIETLKLAQGEELKAAVFGKGEFPDIIGRKKTGTFLKWLVDSELYVHCFHLNLVYWSYIDVIDDCIIYALDNKIIPTGTSEFNLEHFMKIHKDALYDVITTNAKDFFELLSKYNFPEVFGKEKEFIKDLAKFSERSGLKLKEKESSNQLAFNQLTLSFFFKKCQDIDELTLLSDKAKTPIIEDYSLFYKMRAMMFRHSKHLFDQEPRIEKIIAAGIGNHPDFTSDIDYSFHNSKDVTLIQVSDAISGILREYYTFIDTYSPEELAEIRGGLSSRQEENFQLFEDLLDRTDNHCREMFFSVKTVFESYKNDLFAGRR